MGYWLDHAFARLRRNGGDPDLPDVIGLADYGRGWLTVKPRVASQILGANYQPGNVEIIDLPKDELNVRPLARLPLEDRLVYETSVFAMAAQIDRALPREVYSYRWSRMKGDLYAPKSQWMRMQKRGRRLHRAYPKKLLAKTDVTSFYEYVDVRTLQDDLGGLDLPSWATSCAANFLDAFQFRNEAWGLPQGSDASGVLANFYLLPIDRIFAHADLRHLRYSDDVIVFGGDWSELRAALIEVNRTLRSRHLSMSSGKTKIVEADQVMAEFEDTRKDAVRYGIDIASPDARDALREVFNQAVQTSPVNARDVRFALNQFRRIDDPYALDWIFANLSRIPHMMRETLNYLEYFAPKREGIGEALGRSLAKRELHLYPYAERHVISFLLRRGSVSGEVKAACWGILFDRNSEDFLREFAARLVGQNLAPGESAHLRRLFENEPSVGVRRSLLVAMYEGHVASDWWLRAVGGTSPELGLTVDYLLTNPIRIPDPKLVA